MILTSGVLLLALFANASQPTIQEHTFRHENVLGTSFELTLRAESPEAASEAESQALREVDRLAAILSRHDSTSELMRWQLGREQAVSPDLETVLRRAEHWRSKTDGAFDVRAGAFSELWRSAAARGTTVDDEERQLVVQQLSKQPYVFPPGGVQRKDSLAISLDGLAKGYIIECVAERVAAVAGVHGSVVNIGGDLRLTGDHSTVVSVADPADPALNAKPLTSFRLDAPRAVATSGSYHRDVEVEGEHRSHIIDPRTGLPAAGIASATVMAADATDADALATALCVLAPAEGLALIGSLEATECLLVLGDGRRLASPGWPGLESVVQATEANAAVAAEERAAGFRVDFVLNRPEGGRYRRPYVAIWLEDTDGFPVKTAVLWLQTEQPGPRWHRDLTRWYRNDRTRKLVEDTPLIGTISEATRGPGEYTTRFDGIDNLGTPLPDGRYTLCIEVAREHGTYQIIRERLDWKRAQPIAPKRLKDNVEVRDVSYSYVPLASTDDTTESRGSAAEHGR
ncbi:MAG: DUF2271 domain-containing protein [Planctomycetota bacterium]